MLHLTRPRVALKHLPTCTPSSFWTPSSMRPRRHTEQLRNKHTKLQQHIPHTQSRPDTSNNNSNREGRTATRPRSPAKPIPKQQKRQSPSSSPARPHTSKHISKPNYRTPSPEPCPPTLSLLLHRGASRTPQNSSATPPITRSRPIAPPN